MYTDANAQDLCNTSRSSWMRSATNGHAVSKPRRSWWSLWCLEFMRIYEDSLENCWKTLENEVLKDLLGPF